MALSARQQRLLLLVAAVSVVALVGLLVAAVSVVALVGELVWYFYASYLKLGPDGFLFIVSIAVISVLGSLSGLGTPPKNSSSKGQKRFLGNLRNWLESRVRARLE